MDNQRYRDTLTFIEQDSTFQVELIITESLRIGPPCLQQAHVTGARTIFVDLSKKLDFQIIFSFFDGNYFSDEIVAQMFVGTGALVNVVDLD